MPTTGQASGKEGGGVLSQGAESRGAALGPALSGPQAALQRHPCNGVKWGSHCWPPHGPQAAENGAWEAEGTGRREG